MSQVFDSNNEINYPNSKNEINYPNSKNEIKKALEITFEGSSLHAIPNIVRHPFKTVKLVWFICFILCFVLCIFLLIDVVQQYRDHEVVTIIRTIYRNEMPMPVINICRADYDTDKSENTNIFNPNQTLLMCQFNKVDCDLNVDFESFNDGWYGRCYRYNSGHKTPFRSYFNTDIRSSLRFVFYIGSYEENNVVENGFKIFLDNQSLPSLRSYNGIKIAPGYVTDVSIEKYVINQQPQPYSDCTGELSSIESHESIHFKKTFKYLNGTYHYSICKSFCTQKIIGDNCDRQLWHYPHYYSNMTECDDDHICCNDWLIKINSNLSMIKSCDCPLECNESGYIYSTSFAEIGSSLIKEIKNSSRKNLFFSKFPNDLERKYDIYRRTISSVNIFYGELKEIETREEPKMSVQDMWSNIGGVLGLFLGMSVLSFVEFFEILIQSVLIIFRNKKIKESSLPK